MKLEWPQEVGGGFKVRTHSEDLVNHIFYAHDSALSKRRRDHCVAGDRNALPAYFSETSLVDELLHGLEVRVAVGDEGLDQSEHLKSGGIDTNEDTIVKLAKAEELKDFLHLGGHSNDTSNTNDKDELVLCGDIYLVVGLRETSVVNGSAAQLNKQTYTFD